ncbi:glycosyltransferase family 2 protein [Microbacterium sp. P03]|uniref:glycosyltransferase family 2 protein n=1 Tax=Microbacterium sp. P03 TaxID=3366946 RepID=UPI003746E48D
MSQASALSRITISDAVDRRVEDAWQSAFEPHATIVVAVHNADDYLPGLFKQLEDTRHPSFELVLVDDGSTDTTAHVLAELADLAFPALLIRVERNVGVAEARNIALSYARGKYVWMVDGDDSWTSRSLAVMCDAAERTQSELVIAQATRIVSGTERSSRIPAPPRAGTLDSSDLVTAYFRGDIQGQLWNKLFLRNVLTSAGTVFPSLPSKSDVCGLITVLPRITRAVSITDQVYTYHFHAGSIATSRAKPLDLIRVAELSYRLLPTHQVKRFELDLFWVKSIAIPLLTEVWRFDDRSPAAALAMRTVNGGLGIRASARLARRGALKPAAFALGARYAPAVVRAIYRRSRKSEWEHPGL